MLRQNLHRGEADPAGLGRTHRKPLHSIFHISESSTQLFAYTFKDVLTSAKQNNAFCFFFWKKKDTAGELPVKN
jgi:hypothetical protein